MYPKCLVNGTAHLYEVQTKSNRGQLLKGKQNECFMTKNNVILKSFSSFNLSAMFKNTFLLTETNFSIVNCLQWHYKLQTFYVVPSIINKKLKMRCSIKTCLNYNEKSLITSISGAKYDS